MDIDDNTTAQLDVTGQIHANGHRKTQRILRASDAELAEHAQLLTSIEKESKGKRLWLPREEKPLMPGHLAKHSPGGEIHAAGRIFNHPLRLDYRAAHWRMTAP